MEHRLDDVLSDLRRGAAAPKVEVRANRIFSLLLHRLVVFPIIYFFEFVTTGFLDVCPTVSRRVSCAASSEHAQFGENDEIVGDAGVELLAAAVQEQVLS